MCGCEHTHHFNDHYGPQTMHDHYSVPAGTQVAMYVGPICDECATTCMADYLVPAEHVAEHEAVRY